MRGCIVRQRCAFVADHRHHQPAPENKEDHMPLPIRTTVKAAALFAAVALGAAMFPSAGADPFERDFRGGRGFGEDPRIDHGLSIAPVPLNMKGKNPDLVGLGSYLVNAVGECNGCHSAGPATQYAQGGNPYLGQKAAINPATYLGGGRDFGAFPAEPFPHIVSRNLTPGKSGLPAGDLSFADFLRIIRTGVDLDHAHPTCIGAPNGSCIPAPFDGSLLQIMPWPSYADMTDRDLRAIYEYLSAVPCLEGGPWQPAKRCN
jgi:hypothetical protein